MLVDVKMGDEREKRIDGKPVKADSVTFKVSERLDTDTRASERLNADTKAERLDIDTKVSEGPNTDTEASEGPNTDAKASEGPNTYNKAPERLYLDAKASEGFDTDAKASKGHTSDAKASEGPNTYNKAPERLDLDAKASEGCDTDAKASKGHTSDAKASEGPHTYNKAPERLDSDAKAPEKPTDTKGTKIPNTATNGSQRLARLKQLKAKKAESEHKNRKDLFEDHKARKLKTINRRQIEKLKDNAQEEHDKLEGDEHGHDYERQRNLNWSIEEWENWDKKVQARTSRQGESGFDNWSQLAASSYNKEMQKLDVNKEDYQKKKRALMDKFNITHDRDLLTATDFQQTVRASDKQRLVSSINSANDRRTKRSRNTEDEHSVSSYINDKNKQFNLKLNRHYGTD